MMYPAQKRKVPLADGVAVVLVLAALAMPTKVRCGAPGYSCATAVDPQGNVHYYYEVEPVGVYLAESHCVASNVGEKHIFRSLFVHDAHGRRAGARAQAIDDHVDG